MGKKQFKKMGLLAKNAALWGAERDWASSITLNLEVTIYFNQFYTIPQTIIYMIYCVIALL